MRVAAGPSPHERHLGFDHLVVVARDVEETIAFYRRVLGARAVGLEEWRSGKRDHPVLHFGTWKINVHPADASLSPRATRPLSGSADICMKWPGTAADARSHLIAQGVPIELGPTSQEGADGEGQSVYFRDPDGNLLELISYVVP